jgi:hypothetical protein
VSAVLFATFIAARVTGRVEKDCGCFGRLGRRGGIGLHQLSMWVGLSCWLVIESGSELLAVPLAVAVMVVIGAGLTWLLVSERQRRRALRLVA